MRAIDHNRAWIVVVLLFLFMVINFADKPVIGIAAVPIMQELQLGPRQFGLVGSSFFLLFAVSSVATGFLVNRVPTRWVLLAMGLIWALTQFPMIGPGGFGTLVACRIALGAGEGPATPVALHSAYKWFPNELRTLPTAVIVQGGAIGVIANQLAQELSGGWKQRMALAACVLHRPRLLLLDEPTAGVDAKARREFWDMIHEMAADGMTVLVSTHYMDEAERCQRVVYLSGGRLVVQGTADEVVRAASLVTFEATGDGIEQVVRQLRRTPGVETAAVFGRALRIAGMDRAALRTAIDHLGDSNLHWEEVEPRLDDVFIHMLRDTEA